MYTSSKPSPIINTVTLVEGKFKIEPSANTAEIELLMMYSDHETGVTCGTCPVRESIISPETKEAFDKFVELVERDFAQDVLEGGIYAKEYGELGDLRRAESSEGLKPKGIGER